jgi:hypothetical protein
MLPFKLLYNFVTLISAEFGQKGQKEKKVNSFGLEQAASTVFMLIYYSTSG